MVEEAVLCLKGSKKEDIMTRLFDTVGVGVSYETRRFFFVRTLKIITVFANTPVNITI